MFKNLLVTLLLVSSTVAFAGGPWTPKKHTGYFKMSEWWTVFDQHFTDSGQLDPNVTTGIFNTYLYAEYGLTDRFTATLNANLFGRNYMNNLISKTTNEVIVSGESLNSVGDIDLGIKYSLTKQGAAIPVAVSITLGIPTGNEAGGTFGNLQTGDGEFNQLIQAHAGKGFKWASSTPGYVSFLAGMNNRTEGFSDELRFGIEIGVGLFNQKLWLTGRSLVVESLKNGNIQNITSTSIFANNTEYGSIDLEANYYLTQRMGISASVAGAFRGEIVAAAPSFSVGVFIDLTK